MPDRPVPFGEILQNNNGAAMSMQFNSGQVSRGTMSAQVSSMVISGRAKGGVLKDKVGGLMKVASELEDEDDDLIEELRDAALEKEKKEGKKGLFGLFGKK
jgi:hypothetical protein